jgi:hypothetical protein
MRFRNMPRQNCDILATGWADNEMVSGIALERPNSFS